LTGAVRQRIRDRAGGRCEYCSISDIDDAISFQTDHIMARQHGGAAVAANLAYSCSACNSKKGPNLSSVDPKSRNVVRLFDPRRQKWSDHFRASNGHVFGRTAIGRATVSLLAMNDPVNVMVRSTLDLLNDG
jgi:hypothetical protein